MQWPEEVTIREVGPRDGLQNLPAFIPTETKIEIIRGLAEAGVTAIEAASFVSPRVVPQMADAGEVLTGLADLPEDVVLSALVLNTRGMARAAGSGVREVMAVVSASEVHHLKNTNKSVDQSLAELQELCFLARDSGVILRGAVAAAFGCPYQGVITSDQVKKVLDPMAEAGIEEITLADTAGMGNPRQVFELLEDITTCYPSIALALHLHDTKGLGLANVMAGLQAGVTILETSFGGLGGCPFVPEAAGNIATEDLVDMLQSMGINTGISLEGVISCTRMMEVLLGKMLPARIR